MNFNNSVIDWKQVDNVISSSNRILLTTHENPDGDGLGSEVAMYHHLCDEKRCKNYQLFYYTIDV